MTAPRFLSSLSVLLLILSMSVATVSAQDTIIRQQRNQRQLLLFWQEDQVFGKGLHRPYSTVEVSDQNEDVLWRGNTDARGEFTFVLSEGAVNPNYEHRISVSAFDQFDRPVMNEDGEIDLLQSKLLPGLRTQGVTNADAKILLYDEKGKLLNTTTSDENGNYVIFNAPEKSRVVIQKNGQTAEVPFMSETIDPVFIDQDSVQKNPENNSQSQKATNEESQSQNTFFTSFLIIVLSGLGSITILMILKKRRKE